MINDGEDPKTWFARRERLKITANNGNGAGVPLTVAAASFHPDQTTDQDGESSSSNTRRLNPLFVEMLMGYPIGWTGFGGLEMPWSLYRQRLRSAYLQIVRG